MPMLLQTSTSSPPATRRDCRDQRRLCAPAAPAVVEEEAKTEAGMTWMTVVVAVEEAEEEEEDAGARPAPVRQRLPQQLPTRCRRGAARMASLACYEHSPSRQCLLTRGGLQ